MRRIIIVCVALMTLVVNSIVAQNISLQDGDILFREATTGKLSDAIDQVTQTSVETHFSHMGLVEILADSICVLHADTEGGSCRISLTEFLHPEGDLVEVVAYRLEDEWQATIPLALERARQMLGKPYNYSYILSDTSHYCSEFVFRAFETDSVFEMNPMTFKSPQTNDFLPSWVEYYQKLKLEIPEGLPGCNPNGMAASEKLLRLGVIE